MGRGDGGGLVDRNADRGARGPSGPNGAWWPESFLGLLTPTTRTALLGQRRPQVFQTGVMLMRQGDPPTSGMVVILSGRVKVTGSNRVGQGRVLAFRGAGDVVGELGMFSGAPRTATVIVVKQALGIWISAPEFEEFLLRHPEAKDAMIRTVTGKLRTSTSRRIDFDNCDVLAKVAVCLLELAALDGVKGPEGTVVKVTQPELAEHVGASVPSVQKVLQRLRAPAGRGSRQRGPARTGMPVISAARGRITILRMEALEKLADEEC